MNGVARDGDAIVAAGYATGVILTYPASIDGADPVRMVSGAGEAAADPEDSRIAMKSGIYGA